MKKLLKRKIIILFLVIAVFGGYFGHKVITNKNQVVRYLTAAVEKGTIIVSVSGTGQVSALNQVDIKSQVKGDITSFYAAEGKEVKKGSLIAVLDDTDYQKAVEDAEISLETAKLDLEELLAPPDELSLLQAENALSKAEASEAKAKNNIKKGYEDAFNSVTDIFFDLPTIMTTVSNALYSYDIGKSEISISDYDWNKSVYQNSFGPGDKSALAPFMQDAEDSYAAAREKYDQNLKDYKKAGYYSDNGTIESLLDETIQTSRAIAQAIKDEINLLDFVIDYFSSHNMRIYSAVTSYESSLKSYYSKTNNFIQSLSSVKQNLSDNDQAVTDAGISLKEKQLALADLKAGPSESEVMTKENAVRQKEYALTSAQQDLADCNIYAPFDGIIADVKLAKGDSVSAGAVVSSIITKQKIAEISLNEIDAAQVRVGQKTTLTFDALPDLTVSGSVIEVDTLGQVSQGVVSYGVKISLDIQAEKIKSGMSISADIITDSRRDVLVLSNSAIKSQGDASYVEIVEVTTDEMQQKLVANISGIILPQSPKRQIIEIGLSNDTYTEIVSGLKEGDIIVTSTAGGLTANNNQTSQSRTTQGFQIPGMTGQTRFISR